MNLSLQPSPDDEIPPSLNADLLPVLQKAERAVREDLLRQYYADPALMMKARARLRAEESSVADVDAWLVTFAGRAATVYVLKSLYVRVLEDQGLLAPERIRDAGTYPLFAELFPNLGLDAYLKTVFDDARRLLPELFAPTPVEIAEPSAIAARVVWDVWQERRETGEVFTFGDEDLDTRFIGDLYQDLDPQVKDRYALLQTPRFVESFILDRTLTPALEMFDLERFRLLDPTCGSGHFLLGAFKRIARTWRERLGDTGSQQVRWNAAMRALASVSGADLNEYATALTRFRLLLGVVRETGVRDATRLRELHFDVITCDALIPWESLQEQLALEGMQDPRSIRHYGPDNERIRNVAFFARDFHVVVGNPPYKAVADREKREKYHELWPNSARGQYSLSAPMTERFLRLPIEGGQIGLIVAKSFVNREFGEGVIERVIPSFRLNLIIDTSGASLPHHKTPTIILTATRVPVIDSDSQTILVSMVRGGPSDIPDPEHGPVWTSIATNWNAVGYRDRWIAVQRMPQTNFAKHPWVLGSDVVGVIGKKLTLFTQLQKLGVKVGFSLIIKEDEAFVRRFISASASRPVIIGDFVRDWRVRSQDSFRVIFPYIENGPATISRQLADDLLWSYRTTLYARAAGRGTFKTSGRTYYEYGQISPSRIVPGEPKIAFGEIAANSHFVVDKSESIYGRTAPVMTLPGADEARYRDIAAVLNCSTLEFWFKGRCAIKNGWGETWQWQYVRNSKNVLQAPYDYDSANARADIADQISASVAIREKNDPHSILSESDGHDIAASLARARLNDEYELARLVFLQEELDWLMYRVFGLVEDVPLLGVKKPRVLWRGHRPFEIALAKLVDRREEQTKWFSHHGVTMTTMIPAEYDDAHRSVLEARLELIENDETVRVLEQALHKRRWTYSEWDDRVHAAASAFVADALEAILQEAGPEHPLTLDDCISSVERDDKVHAVAALLESKKAKIGAVVQAILDGCSIPDSPSRLFKASGLEKFAGDAVEGARDSAVAFSPGSATDWKRVWRLQEREDAGEPIEVMSIAPPFTPADYAHPNGWKFRDKFNVPNERFIVYDDVNPRRYGWGGWTIAQRARASLEIFQLRNYENEGASDRPADDASRCPIQFALWDKLDELRRLTDPIEPFVRSIAGICEAHCPCPVLDRWRAMPVGKKKKPKAATLPTASLKGAPSVELDEDSAGTPLDPAVVDAIHASIRAAGERGRSSAELLVAAAGDGSVLRRVVAALRARGEIEVIGKGRGTRYVDPREVERLAAAELPLL